MTKCISILAAIAALFSMHASAHAHLGHLGELAGHSHWIGVGAVAAAAAIAVLVARPRKEGSTEEAEISDDPEIETEEEPAS